MIIDEFAGLAAGTPAAGLIAVGGAAASASPLTLAATASAGSVGDMAVGAFGCFNTVATTWSPNDGSTADQTKNVGATFLRSIYGQHLALAGAGVFTAARRAPGTGANQSGVAVIFPANTPPSNTILPALSNLAPLVGQTVTCSTGTWSPTPDAYAYQWQSSSDGVSGWANVIGATSSSLTITNLLAGLYFRCVVTASLGGSAGAPATSNATTSPVPAGLVGVQQQTIGRWRVLITDRFGNTIGNVSPIAFSKTLTETLNRPAVFSFKVPANDLRVRTIRSDGYPVVAEGRGVRAFRYELQADGSSRYVCRFAGPIWQISDDGDESSAWSTVTCFDPLQVLNRRLARQMYAYSDAVGGTWPIFYAEGVLRTSPSISDTFTFAPADNRTASPVVGPFSATTIARGLLNCSNLYDGFSGLVDGYASQKFSDRALTIPQNQAASSVQEPQAPVVSPTYDHKRVGEAITDLCAGYNMFDLVVTPLDGSTKFNYYGLGLAPEYQGGSVPVDQLWTPSAASPSLYQPNYGYTFRPWASLTFAPGQRGTTRPACVFSWGQAPHTVRQISRVVDLEQLVNNAFAVGADTFTSVGVVDLNSVARLGAGVDSESYSDVTDATHLAALAAEITQLGKAGAPTYVATPTPGRSPLPYDDFGIGDTVTMRAGAALRGGFSGLHRVYGFTFTIPDNGGTEILSQLVTSPVVS
jgi:hypothetical protein